MPIETKFHKLSLAFNRHKSPFNQKLTSAHTISKENKSLSYDKRHNESGVNAPDL